ncbi:hypothetical protein ACP6PL_01185 [Dapis sp. BLCC M126]|uniref:hypothetical protein n=1 Tax=Dapis sp. BLCC M126 TaxID=3400189 RepID=UPI003CED2A09
MEPVSLTAAAIATLAFTKALEKTVEKFTEGALKKMDELRLKIWDRLKGNSKAEKAITAVEQGSKQEIERLAVYLQDVMEDDQEFAAEVQALAKEIEAGKKQEPGMNQYLYDSAKGIQQVKAEGGTNYIAAEINQTFYEKKI